MNRTHASYLSLGLSLSLALAGTTPSIAAGTDSKSATAGSAPQKTTTFISKEDGFSISFPARPTKRTTAVKAAGDSFATSVYQAEGGKITYLLIVTEVRTGNGRSRRTQFIDAVQRGLLRTSHAQLLKSRDVALGRTPGRELDLSLKSGASLSRAYIYATPGHSYELMAIGAADEYKREWTQIAKVLSSFRMVGT